MRWILAILLCGLTFASARAGQALPERQNEARKAQVSAAANDAADSLRREVLAAKLVGGMSVEDFITLTGSQQQLDDTIRSADQIGGARWLDGQTVQVRRELRGRKLVTTLLAIAVRHPQSLPVPLATFRNRLNTTLYSRTFSATGSSTSSAAAGALRPDPSQGAWRKVSDPSRREAIDSARKNAVDHVVDSLKPLQLDSGRRLDEFLALPIIGDPLRAWLAARPVRSIQFMDDLEIRLTLAATPQELWPNLRTNMEKQSALPVPRARLAWEHLRKQVEARMAPAIGTALAKAPAPATGPAVQLPAQAPAWIDGAAEGTGVSPPVGGNKLKTARAAEGIALAQLRGKLNALPLPGKLTLGDAADKDPRIKDSLSRILNNAHIAKVEYDTPMPGWVRVQMSIDLQTAWTELSGQ
ncbi:MAG TPA: hypothetical protein VFC78_03975 [Tepidisphaeraceae bacterium]|nr:hypothetical protein [Tepidisphaeraceae bacterium]